MRALYRSLAAAVDELNSAAADLSAEEVADAVRKRIEERPRAAQMSFTGWLSSPVPAWAVVVLLLMFPLAWSVWRVPPVEVGVEKGAPSQTAPAVVPGPINRGLDLTPMPSRESVAPSARAMPVLADQPADTEALATSGLDALQLFEMLYGADATETGELVAVARLLEAYYKKHPEDLSVRVKLVAVYTTLTQRPDVEQYGLTRAEVRQKLQDHRSAVEKKMPGLLRP
ncbi:MAG: hypothetical protein N2512_13730 [Armatimonadetes bacterium]|nr:hypothetical protein [Armatimonadota bacterium]